MWVSWMRTRALAPLLVAAAVVALPRSAVSGDSSANGPSNRITATSGKVSLSKQDMSCLPSGSVERQPLGAVLAEPGLETLYPYAIGLSSIVDLGAQGYAITVSTRAFSTGPFKGGGDVMLAGMDRNFNPLWATVIGGPGPDGPSSMTRTADGGFAVVGTTKSLFFSPMRWLKIGPEAVLLSKYGRDGSFEWAQYLTPGDDVGANPVVSLPGGGMAFGGVAWLDGRWSGFLMRLSDRGERSWGRLLGRDHENGITWITSMADGSLLVSGARQATRPPPKSSVLQMKFDVWIAKITGQGEVEWAKSYAVDSGVSMVVTAANSRGGFIVVREPRIDDKAGVSRLPVLEIDAQGEVLWAQEYEFQGEVGISSVAEAGSGNYLLFGTTVQAGETGGPLTLEVDRTGRTVASTWVDVVTALSTPDRRSGVQVGAVSVNRDPDGRFVIMGDTVNISTAIIAQAGSVGKLPENLKSDLKGVMYFARLDENGRAGACSLPIRSTQRSLEVKGVALDLPAVDIPAQKSSPFIPEGNLSIERIVPR
jgi:hypothetical protein